MRNAGRFERRLIYSNRRGLLSKSRSSRTKLHYRILAGALLLLCGVLWLIRPVDHGGIRNKSSQKIESWEEDFTDEDFDHVSLNNTEEAAAGEEVREQHVAQGASDAGDDDDANAFEMSLSHNKEEEADQRKTENDDYQIDDDKLCDRSIYPAEAELLTDQITILVNGFSESRLPLLQKNLLTYSMLPLVHSIYILWGNISSPEDFSKRWNFSSFGAPIYLARQVSTSLNGRFLPRKYIKTRVVAICDDDITVDLQSLKFAVDVWQGDQDRIVGFFPRTHLYDPESKSWLYTRHYKSYSIMLTKFMILATEYLYRYTCEMPAGVKEYVDGGMNCEDIAMNFLVSSHSRKGPVLVEGKARDWGDPRNSAVEDHFKEPGLSRKSNHLKDRGDCITAFQKLWNGMRLQYSYAKASSDLENEIQCEKFGYLVDCDKSVGSKREARRIVGENILSFSHRFAYATFLSSDEHINASILLAQSLRSSGTIHDLVLLLDFSCRTISESHVLYEHYDEVVRVNRSRGASGNGHGKLSTWLLLEYAKVVYVEVHSLVLANLDHLFQLPEPAAAPELFMPGKLSTGLLVLTPSKTTYSLLLQLLDGIGAEHCSVECLLNSFFDGWFQMPVENRLPVRYNLPVVFSKELKIPSWFDVNRASDYLGPLMVVRYGNEELMSKNLGQSSTSTENTWVAARLKLFDDLEKNALHPLESYDVMDWAPMGLNSSHQTKDLHWRPASEVSLMGLTALGSERFRARAAFVTTLYDSQHPQFPVAGWAESFHHHHSFQSRPTTLLLVLSTLDPDQYEEYTTYFDEVRIVEPFAVNERVLHKSFTLLHLWNQTDFDKLVYVAPNSLFQENCNSLLDYAPFAAVSSLFPPDTFSTQAMSIQPDQQTCDLFKKNLLSYEFYNQPVERFLNAHYSDWYQKSSRHRISPSYMISVGYESHFQNSALPRKVLNFDVDWLPDEEANVTRLWKKALCGLKPGTKPNILSSLCGTV